MATSLGVFYRSSSGDVMMMTRDADGTWAPEQALGGQSVSDITVAFVPDTQVLQIFYQGTVNGIKSRWRTAAGRWSDEESIGGHPFYPPGSPGQQVTCPITAARVPGTEVLQLFYPGPEGGVMSLWREADGSWSAEQELGGTLSTHLTSITAIQIPGSNVLQLFYPGVHDGVVTRWRNPDGAWSAEQNLAGENVGPVTAVAIPGTGELRLFYPPAINGTSTTSMRTRSRSADGTWSPEEHLGGTPSYTWPSNIAATWVPGLEILQLFYGRLDQWSLATLWEDPVNGWSAEQPLGLSEVYSPIAATILPFSGTVQLLCCESSGAIWTVWRNADGTWSAPQRLPGTMGTGGRLAVAPVP